VQLGSASVRLLDFHRHFGEYMAEERGSMRQLRSWTVLMVMLAAAAFSVAAQSTTQKRDIVLDLSLPNGGTPQLRIADGETGTVQLPKLGKFGFVPALQEGNPGVVVVELFDLNRTPHQRMARLELNVGGDRVQSDTTPNFGVRVARVLTR
jgi:hypothetical protein